MIESTDLTPREQMVGTEVTATRARQIEARARRKVRDRAKGRG